MNKYRYFIILGLIILALINIFYNKGVFTIFPFFGQIIFYFLLGFNKDFLKDKIFIFSISALVFLLLNSSTKTDFLLEMYFTYQFPFYIAGFCLGLIFSRFDFYLKLSILMGILPLLLQSFFLMLFKLEPFVVLYILYLIIPLVYFYYLKILKINILVFFLLPTLLYLTIGIFAFDKPSLKVLLISFSFILIVIIEFFLIGRIIKSKL